MYIFMFTHHKRSMFLKRERRDKEKLPSEPIRKTNVQSGLTPAQEFNNLPASRINREELRENIM